MARIKKLNIEAVEYIAFILARQWLTFDEPIPDFHTRFPHILESCLNVPFQTFGKRNFYPTLIAKAAILFYLLIKNHPFQNGNKRLAVTTLLVFLNRNNKWLKVSERNLYRFSIEIAESYRDDKDSTILKIQKFLTEHLIIARTP